MKKRRKSISISSDLYSKVQTFCDSSGGRSVSGLVTELLQDLMNRHGICDKEDPRQQHLRVIDGAGIFTW